MSNVVEFCRVVLPKTNKNQLLDKIRNSNNVDRLNLSFLYSEFLLRANRNSAYAKVLNDSDLSAIDGKGLQAVYFRHTFPLFKRIKILQILNPLILLLNIIATTIGLLFTFKIDYTTKRTQNEVVLGRDFVYDLFNLANEKGWKIAVIGGNDKVQKGLQSTYPKLDVSFWYKPSDSDLMRDKPKLNKSGQGVELPLLVKHQFLNTDNLDENYPDLTGDAVNWLSNQKADLILVCLGGASGKQEIFMDYLKTKTNINYRLITGLGAALDHLGAGKEQKRVNPVLEKFGLESLHRMLFIRGRRERVWDSVFNLWWYSCLSPMVKPGKAISLGSAFSKD